MDQLEDDSGGFRLTIAKWLTPDRTWIHGKGIVPDVVVADAPAKPGDDPVLDAGLKALGDEAPGGREGAAAGRVRGSSLARARRSGRVDMNERR